MKTISLDNLYVDFVIKSKNIIELQINTETNDHAKMSLSYIVDDNVISILNYNNLKNEKINIYYFDENKRQSLFFGIVLFAKLIVKNLTSVLQLNCISLTYLMDINLIKKSYQNTDLSYKKILKDKENSKNNIIVAIDKNKKIDYPIIQYNETDWQFIKRLGSHFQSVVIPEIKYDFLQLSIGNPIKNEIKLNDDCMYQITNYVYNSYVRSNISKNKFIEYKVTQYNDYDLGDKICFKNQILTLVKKNIILKNSILEIVLYLGSEEAWGLSKIYNDKISGMSIEGKVIQCNNEKIKLHLDIDNTQNIVDAYYYSFVPNTGNIMYSMPELGAKASLYFSNSDEKNAMVINCIANKKKKYAHHFSKHLSTPKTKNIFMTRKMLSFTGKNQNKLGLYDFEDGDVKIDITSLLPITLEAKGNITFESSSNFIAADVFFELLHKNTDNYIEMSGNDIILNSEKFLFASADKNIMPDLKNENSDIFFPSTSIVNKMIGGMPKDYKDESSSKLLSSIPVVCNVLKPILLNDEFGLKIKY